MYNVNWFFHSLDPDHRSPGRQIFYLLAVTTSNAVGAFQIILVRQNFVFHIFYFRFKLFGHFTRSKNYFEQIFDQMSRLNWLYFVPLCFQGTSSSTRFLDSFGKTTSSAPSFQGQGRDSNWGQLYFPVSTACRRQFDGNWKSIFAAAWNSFSLFSRSLEDHMRKQGPIQRTKFHL